MKIKTIIKISLLILVIALSIFVYDTLKSSIISLLPTTETIESSYSQFVSMKGLDEYTLAELKTSETFTKEQFDKIAGITYAKSNASVSVVASYKYYIKLSELKMELKDKTLILSVPNLRIQSPVAFESSTIKENSYESMLALNSDKLQNDLRNSISHKLMIKGHEAKSSVYEKAARALAENMNQFIIKNNFNIYYDNISVRMDKQNVPSNFDFKNSYCEGECFFEIPIGDEKVFVYPRKN